MMKMNTTPSRKKKAPAGQKESRARTRSRSTAAPPPPRARVHGYHCPPAPSSYATPYAPDMVLLLLLSPLFTRRRHHQSVHGPHHGVSYPCCHGLDRLSARFPRRLLPAAERLALAAWLYLSGCLDSGGAGFTCSSPLDAGWWLPSLFILQPPSLGIVLPCVWRRSLERRQADVWVPFLALLHLHFSCFVASPFRDFRRLPTFVILLSVGFEIDGTDDNEESGFVTRQSRPLV